MSKVLADFTTQEWSEIQTQEREAREALELFAATSFDAPDVKLKEHAARKSGEDLIDLSLGLFFSTRVIMPIGSAALNDFELLCPDPQGESALPRLVQLHAAAIAGGYDELALAIRSLRCHGVVDAAAEWQVSRSHAEARGADRVARIVAEVRTWKQQIVEHLRTKMPREYAAVATALELAGQVLAVVARHDDERAAAAAAEAERQRVAAAERFERQRNEIQELQRYLERLPGIFPWDHHSLIGGQQQRTGPQLAALLIGAEPGDGIVGRLLTFRESIDRTFERV